MANPQTKPESRNPDLAKLPTPATSRAFRLAPDVLAHLSPAQVSIRPEDAPMPAASALGEILQLLRKLVEQSDRVESAQPILRVWEFDLTPGQSGCVAIDTNVARWIVWCRTTGGAGDFCRIAQGDSIPTGGAIDLSSGRTAIIPAAGRKLMVVNAGASASLHVSIVADSGGQFMVL